MDLDRMKLVIVEAGQNLIRDGEKIYAPKLGNTNYVKEISRHFGQAFYVTNCYTPDTTDDFAAKRERYVHRFEPGNINLKTTHSFKRNQALAKLCSQLEEFVYLFRHVDSDTVVLVFVNGLYGLVKLPMLMACRPGYVFTYYGSDPLHYASRLHQRGGLGNVWKASMIRSLHLKMVQFSEGVFLRDMSMRRDIPEGKKVCFSHPFNSFSVDDLHEREREDFDWGDPVSLLFVGSLIPRKGVKDLLRAMKFLADSAGSLPRFHLTIAGLGPHKEELTCLAESLDLEGQVTFRGFISEREVLRGLYRESDLMVLPARHEGFPRVLTEAMSQHLPVITTSVDGIGRVLEHERECLLVEPSAPNHLAEGIRRLVRNPELRRRIADGGRKFAAERLSESPSSQHMRFIRGCLASRRRADETR